MCKPVTCALMVYTKFHSSKSSKFLCNLPEIFILQRTVNRKCQCNILSVLPYITHKSKRLTIHTAANATKVREIIVIRIIPLKMNFHILASLTYPLRPFLILRIIGVHNTNISVRSAEHIQYVILIYIFGSLTTIP